MAAGSLKLVALQSMFVNVLRTRNGVCIFYATLLRGAVDDPDT